ncbi:Glucanase [Pleurostoma richardsiae]|uniref:Glucanase n=1 Tax=Pleurostoma richardsiae TaxID=41990 RepID=A0AA38R2T3_9PEZI|nr:Glucanase [Pleurostoma richardsiae]
MVTNRLLVAAALSTIALAAPLEERQSCATVWGQCGGQGYSGATCCASGSTCVYSNPYYSQCLPGTASSSSSSTTTTTSSTTSKTSSSTSVTSLTSSKPTSSVTSTTKTTTTASGGGSPGSTASFTGNPFIGVQQWANSYYASEISASAIPTLTGAMATQAAAVAKVPTFQWLDTADKVPTLMAQTLSDIRAANKAASPPYAGLFVVYDLPDRDCAAAASNGEYSIADDGVTHYKAYIDAIREQLVAFSDLRIILVVEPDSLANLVTNLNVAKCSNAQSAYLECTNYALTQLNLPNVAMYLDAGHAGWLGWSANLSPAAQLFAQVYSDAGKPSQVRGLATNVANYNGWNLTSAPSYTQGDSNYDEIHYVQAIAPLLSSAGFSAHFITDQGRSGKQPTGQQQWGDWCNVKGTGFGIRPTSSTGLELEDAFVWVKPGGECDGTSDTSAARYDYHCGLSDALQPAPEAGTWFEAYFEQLLTNANPAF